jgi:hypothetical protein
MSSNIESTQDPITAEQSSVVARLTSAERNWSYSRKRWNAFDTWQEHVRRYAATVGTTFSARPDRDVRRTIIAG